MLQADEIIDMGPGAGEYGGKIVSQGTANTLDPRSLTAGYLNGSLKVACAAEPIEGKAPEQYISLTGCTGNNLKGVDLRIPLAPSSASPESAAQANRPSSTKPSTRYLARHFIAQTLHLPLLHR